MPKPNRLRLIRRIEKVRGTRVIAYVTSTRANLEVPMAMDVLRKVYDHLRAMGSGSGNSRPKVDLFLHSNGGDGTVPWRLVTLIREHASRFSVLVPHRAFSAATLTVLGADSVFMHPMGMLGPTDPTVTNPFNPPDPANPANRLGISVEDVTAYLALVRDDAGIQHEDEMVQAFSKLADHVHPLALGNVKRSLSQSRMMAKKLLALHMHLEHDAHRIDEIVDNLTSKLFYHGHPINRNEAREQVGLATVEAANPELEELIWSLYLEYEAEMKLEEPFQPALEFVAQNPNMQPGQMALTPTARARIAFVESRARTDISTLDYQIAGGKNPAGVTNVQMLTVAQGWTSE